ncbi:hypothetical protein PPYR_09194 [Photinus pyralis]|uniref:Lipid-binding serum glycoprotein N-terminal domain-containing protein n=2 Tax=Photinus pyralis TaxID=7054 RepID=A0A5N4ALK5_PHOPY|nr:uncharacterized protein LOC116172716 isoform X2 [Photinus pyralis]KAB0798201.1 hypothetical protein PPYR_09194 [Photinus pyralis]
MPSNFIFAVAVFILALTGTNGSPGGGRTVQSVNRTITEFFRKLNDPLFISHDNYSHLEHSVEVNNVTIGGISKVHASVIRLPRFLSRNVLIVLNAPKLEINITQYNVTDGKTSYGNGSARISIENVKIEIKAVKPLFKRDISIKNVSVFVGHGQVNITGLYNDEEKSMAISQNMTRFLNNEFNTNKKAQAKIDERLKKLIEKQKHKMFKI